jgi:DNA-binding response OmpR family regulator
MYEACKGGPETGFVTCASELFEVRSSLVIDAAERRLCGVTMPSLLSGEYALLVYLGARSGIWHTTAQLATAVYGRSDPGGRELVWKYASTLRKRVADAIPGVIEMCRRRGYRCLRPVVIWPAAGQEGDALGRAS